MAQEDRARARQASQRSQPARPRQREPDRQTETDREIPSQRTDGPPAALGRPAPLSGVLLMARKEVGVAGLWLGLLPDFQGPCSEKSGLESI